MGTSSAQVGDSVACSVTEGSLGGKLRWSKLRRRNVLLAEQDAQPKCHARQIARSPHFAQRQTLGKWIMVELSMCNVVWWYIMCTRLPLLFT